MIATTITLLLPFNRLTAICDSELASRLHQDDRKAFDELYTRYHKAIYLNAFRLTRDEGIAEDIVQESFIALWEKRYGIDPGQPVAGWLFTVSYNKSLNVLKKKSREQTAIMSLIMPQEEHYDAAGDFSVSQHEILEKAIEQLSPQRRRVFELCKLQHKTYEQAAEELHLSRHTVKEYLGGAMSSLREFAVKNGAFTSSCQIITCLCMLLL